MECQIEARNLPASLAESPGCRHVCGAARRWPLPEPVKNLRRKILLLLLGLAGVGVVSAQNFRYRGSPEDWTDEDEVRTAREVMPRTYQLPPWTNPRGFEKDVFTFARVIFQTDMRRPGDVGFAGRLRRGWAVDFPDADLNFSYRLQQMTSLRVDSDGRAIKLTNPEIFDYPWIFMTHVERMALIDEEQEILRQYLRNGGVLLVNDYWGAAAHQNLVREMRQVLPGRTWTELTMEHPIFHAVFDLRMPMQELRVPTIHRWNTEYAPGDPASNPTAGYRGEGYETMHVRAIFDDNGRIMVLAIHNSDVSDGWEREGENAEYFAFFSEPRAYPLGINIVFYLMTH
jgi:hypothetical protein